MGIERLWIKFGDEVKLTCGLDVGLRKKKRNLVVDTHTLYNVNLYAHGKSDVLASQKKALLSKQS